MTAPGEIVWLASFPRSGNTWFRILLANLTAEEAGPADINELDQSGGIASNRHEFEAATLLDSGLLSHDEIDCLRPRVYEAIIVEAGEQRWIKVHDAYNATPAGEPLLGRNVARAAIYLVRDPRDVAVSLAHHHNSSIDDTIKLMNSADGAFSASRKGQPLQLRQKHMGWSGHVTSWLDQTDVPVHSLRYEDLAVATAERFAAALNFACRAATKPQIERAVRHADFSELRRQEGERGFAERMFSKMPFFRSGRAGSWREALTAGQAATIEQCHGAVMARLGYV